MAEARVRLVAWNQSEAAAVAARLRAEGFVIGGGIPTRPDFLQELARRSPQAIDVGLDRLPSLGRELAVASRPRQGTRHVTIGFLGGERARVASARRQLPEGVHTSPPTLPAAARRAIDGAPLARRTPESDFAPDAADPPVKMSRLGPGTAARLIGAPKGFAELLAPLPGS